MNLWRPLLCFALLAVVGCEQVLGLDQPYGLANAGGGGAGGDNQGGGGQDAGVASVCLGSSYLVEDAFSSMRSVAQAGTFAIADVNGDGRGEVCGEEGGAILCYATRPRCDAPGTVVWQASFGEGWLEAHRAGIRYGDVDGDGRTDLCGLDATGIRCALSREGEASATATLWTSAFASSLGVPSQSETLQLVDIDADGDADVCGRTSTGIRCAESSPNGGGADLPWSAALDFSDSFPDWQQEYYYRTIRFVDVSGDGYPDACARTPAGLQCGVSRLPGEPGFESVSTWSLLVGPMSWHAEPYWSTIRFGDVDGDGRLDFCARGDAGIYCARSLGTVFTQPATLVLPELADQAGYVAEIRYRSITLTDVDGDERADLCARDGGGFVCALASPNAGADPATWWGAFTRWSGAFADDGVFENDPTQWRTLQVGETDGVPGSGWCARSEGGVRCTR